MNIIDLRICLNVFVCVSPLGSSEESDQAQRAAFTSRSAPAAELVRFSNKLAEVLNGVTSASGTESYLEQRAKHRTQLGARSVKCSKPGPVCWPAPSEHQFIFDLAGSHYDFMHYVLVERVMVKAKSYEYNFILQILPLQLRAHTFFGYPHQD